MADLNKFEKMLELLVNEDKEAAQELFHEIVVEKSRDIYESLLEDEEVDEEVDESDEDLDEADHDDEEVDEDDDLDENFNLDTFEVEADDEEAADEEADDMDMDDEADDMDMDDDDGDVEDRVEDLEDALDDLKAEFEKLMAGGEGDGDDDADMGGDATDDMMADLGMDDDETKEDTADDSFQATITPLESKAALSAGEQMREYVEKISATMGDNGADTKSAVAGPNNMGGTSANLAKGGESKGAGTQGGLAAPTPKDMNTKNVNVPGAKGATKMSSTKGHGAEKKASGDNGVNTKPVIGK